MPVALVLSRTLRITPREALALLREPRVMPIDLSPENSAALVDSLKQLGLQSELIDVPPSASRCAVHPSLTTDAQCDECRASVCALCAPLCPRCRVKRARAAAWKHLRVAVLLVVLAGVVSFGVLKQRARDARHSWARSLRASVVLASPAPVSADELQAWRDGAEALQRWFSNEAARTGLSLETPVLVTLAPGIVAEDAPTPPATTGAWVDDSKAALAFRARLTELAAQSDPRGDVRVVVALRSGGSHRVEGVGEAGGSIGLVEGTLGDTALSLELLAVAHEVLHLLGAQDAYDEHGHALPRGIVEPAAGYPQKFAEVMVGEVPVSETEGRVPTSLDEVRIGETTAKEIGWK